MMIGAVIRKWRVMSDFTLREASKRMGVSTATLSRIERGENMDGKTLATLLTWLVGESPTRGDSRAARDEPKVTK